MTCDLENYSVAVERVQEYADCPQEVRDFFHHVHLYQTEKMGVLRFSFCTQRNAPCHVSGPVHHRGPAAAARLAAGGRRQDERLRDEVQTEPRPRAQRHQLRVQRRGKGDRETR